MKKRHLFLILLFILLTTCTRTEKNNTPTPTISAPTGPLDGKWQGSGQANGIPYKVSFTIQNLVVTEIEYSFINSKKTSCLNINYIPIEKTQRPQVANNSFSANLGPDLEVSAIFKDNASASGHLSGTLTGYRRETLCNGT